MIDKPVRKIVKVPTPTSEIRYRPFIPFITFSLFVLNVSCYFLAPGGWPFEYDLFWANPISLLGCLFSHASTAHLMGNMLFLVLFGPVSEKRLGQLQFLFLYLVAGFASALGYGYFYQDAMLVGASGAIAGLIAVYPFVQTNWVSRLIAGFCTGFLMFNEFINVMSAPSLPGYSVAHLGHVGGAVGGLVIFAWLSAKKHH